MVTLIFLRGLCGYVWVNILTLSPPRGRNKTISTTQTFPQMSQTVNHTINHISYPSKKKKKKLKTKISQGSYRKKCVCPWYFHFKPFQLANIITCLSSQPSTFWGMITVHHCPNKDTISRVYGYSSLYYPDSTIYITFKLGILIRATQEC